MSTMPEVRYFTHALLLVNVNIKRSRDVGHLKRDSAAYNKWAMIDWPSDEIPAHDVLFLCDNISY